MKTIPGSFHYIEPLLSTTAKFRQVSRAAITSRTPGGHHIDPIKPFKMEADSTGRLKSSTVEDPAHDFVTVDHPAESPVDENPNFGVAEGVESGELTVVEEEEGPMDNDEDGSDGPGVDFLDSEDRSILPEELSRNVVVLTCESADGSPCDIYLVGTAHVSEESCREVRDLIQLVKPQVVFLELCPIRVAILTLRDLKVPTMSEMIDMWKNKQNPFGVVYSQFLAKVADKIEVLPGSEFRVGYKEARELGSKVILGDRPVNDYDKKLSKAHVDEVDSAGPSQVQVDPPVDLKRQDLKPWRIFTCARRVLWLRVCCARRALQKRRLKRSRRKLVGALELSVQHGGGELIRGDSQADDNHGRVDVDENADSVVKRQELKPWRIFTSARRVLWLRARRALQKRRLERSRRKLVRALELSVQEGGGDLIPVQDSDKDSWDLWFKNNVPDESSRLSCPRQICEFQRMRCSHLLNDFERIRQAVALPPPPVPDQLKHYMAAFNAIERCIDVALGRAEDHILMVLASMDEDPDGALRATNIGVQLLGVVDTLMFGLKVLRESITTFRG